MRTNLVRLSEFEHKQVERAREELMQQGIANLPNIKPLCPSCGEYVDGFKISYEHLHCNNCGWKEDSASVTGVGAFALGAVAAFGAAALMYLLAQRNKNE